MGTKMNIPESESESISESDSDSHLNLSIGPTSPSQNNTQNNTQNNISLHSSSLAQTSPEQTSPPHVENTRTQPSQIESKLPQLDCESNSTLHVCVYHKTFILH